VNKLITHIKAEIKLLDSYIENHEDKISELNESIETKKTELQDYKNEREEYRTALKCLESS